MEVSGRANGILFRERGDEEKDKQILQPFTYLLKASGKELLPVFIHPINYWLKVPADKLTLLEEVFRMIYTNILLTDDIQDNAILRKGIPVAHSIYGVASSISAANCLIYMALEKVLSLNHPEATKIFAKLLLEVHRGQALEVYFRDNYKCPSVEEYQENAERITGSSFIFATQLMQLFSENKADFTKLLLIMGLYYQIWSDYCSLWPPKYTQYKGYGEDITEGKFSFPIIHAIMSHPEDNQVIYILRQRTQDVAVKKYFISLLEKFGSFSHTRHTLEKLDAEVRAEVAKLGGNPLFEDVLDEMLDWKRDTDEKNPEQ